MRLKIVSDGLPHKTIFIDADTGQEIELPVSKVIWEISGGIPSKATLEVDIVAAEIMTENMDMLCQQCKYRKEDI